MPLRHNRPTARALVALAAVQTCLMIATLFAPLSARAAGPCTSCTWTGGAADDNWTSGLNWSGGSSPATDGSASLTFPAGPTDKTTNNDITAGTTFTSIALSDGGYTLAGNAVSVSGTITASAASGTNTISLAIGGAAALTKSGAGTLTLSGTNTYTGLTSIPTNGGILAITNGSALGGTSAGTSVASNAQLQLSGGITVSSEPLTLNGTGFTADGALKNISGNNAWGGDVTLTGTSRINSLADTLTLAGTFTGANELRLGGNGNVTVTGAIATGTGALTKNGLGTLTFAGANTYSGTTTISAGMLRVGAGGTTGTLGSGAVTDSAALVVDRSDAITIANLISGAGTLTQAGSGTSTLTANNTYVGTTTVSAGTLLVNGQQTASAVSLAGGTLGGNGRVGAITSTSGTVAPGTSPGVLSSGNVDWNNLTTFNVELNGIPAGTGYDQLKVFGTVKLGTGVSNSALAVSLGFAPSATTAFTIIDNDGTADAVSGTFDGLAEGANVTATYASQTYDLKVSYLGGDGNDVVLTYSACSSCTWTGNGADDNWSTGANWSGGNRPATDGSANLTFPVGPTDKSTNNDFTGVTFSSITLSDGGYTLAGNSASVSGTIADSAASGTNAISLDLSGTATLTKSGAGTLTLSGTNTYSGATAILTNGGVLAITNGSALGSAAAGTSVGDNAQLQLIGGITVAGEPLTLDGTGFTADGALKNISGNNAWGGAVTLAGTSRVNSAADTLTMSGGFSGPYDLHLGGNGNMVVTGAITTSGGLTKSGPGTITLTGANTYPGTTEINNGTLLVNGADLSSAIDLSGGTLGGIGTTGAVTASLDGGTVAPGTSPGTLTTGTIGWNATTTFDVELDGTTAGSGYDQLQVIGGVTLGGATLNASVGYAAAGGDVFVILANDDSDPISGTFAGLAEGATFVTGGYELKITYAGGDGNDIALKVIPFIQTTTVVSIDPHTVPYGGSVTLEATVSAPVYPSTLSGSVEFFVGSTSLGSVDLPGDTAAQTVTLNVATLPGSVGPGDYKAKAVFTATAGSDYYGSQGETGLGAANDGLTVTNGCVTTADDFATLYTGNRIFWTPSNSSTATLTLSAVIRACDLQQGGDITTARISFAIRNGTTLTLIPGGTNLKVGLVDPATPWLGIASVITQYTLGKTETAATLEIVVIVGGNYTYSGADDATPILIAKAVPGMISGAGAVGQAASGGILKGALTETADFSFFVNYTKSGSNPKGKMTIYFESWRRPNGTTDTSLHLYRIQANAIAALSVKNGAYPRTAIFSAKATLVDVTDLNSANWLSIDGGAVLQVTMTHGSATGAGDKIGIQLVSSKGGGLWYSSDWLLQAGKATTVEQAISAGQLTVQ